MTSLGALVCAALFAGALTPAAQASFDVAKWEAGTCTGSEAQVKECKYSSPHSAFYTQAAGHPPWGLTGFEMTSEGGVPSGPALKNIRVDVPPGLAADPVTLGTCTRAQFTATPTACPADSEAGFVELKAYVEIPLLPQTLTLKGKVFNLPEEKGLPLSFGIDVEGVPPLVGDTKLYLEGHVSYAFEPGPAARGVPTGDYHEWFTIKNIPPEVAVELLTLEVVKAPLKTLESKLFFNGRAGMGSKENFLTLPSDCTTPPKSFLEVENAVGEKQSAPTVPPVGIEKCDASVPFKPTTLVTPETSQYDTPDGAVTEVKVPQKEGGTEINTADIRNAKVVLPEGLTLNPSAAHGLEACTPAQLGKGTESSFGCPAASKIGTVTIETDLPPNSLTGNVYLGKPNGTGLITQPPYGVFLDAETELGVKVKLEGQANPNPTTGRLEVTFLNNPQLPFSDLILKLNGGPRAPLANPVTCGTATTDSEYISFTTTTPFNPSSPFTTTGCPSTIPFSLSQGTSETSNKAAAFTSFTFSLARNDGNQNLGAVQTTLPAGLVGLIPSIKLCNEPQAAAGSCAAASQIGTATASAGVGSEPYVFSGPVYLTGPTAGQPYGLSIPIEAAAGPFDLGRVTTRVAIGVDEHTGRVIATANLPRIVGGVPLHLRGLSVAVNKSNFLFNPTNCGPLATESTLTSTFGAIQGLSSPFQVGNCSALAFKPSFKTSTSAKTSKLNGASLQVSITQGAHQANMKSVFVELPKQLPSRLTTLQKACPEATFAANPVNCRTLGSEVGTATVVTPVLPGTLSGSAYLVSHGGEAFPDLDIVLEGDGVRVILTGNTKITKGITSSTFAAIPDVPVTSFVLNLPVGPHSALTAIGGLCLKPLLMPTTITAQSGAQVKQNTRISVSGCSVRILSHRVVRHKLIIKVRTLGAGLITLKGKGLRSASRRVSKSATVTFKLPLTRGGLKALSKAHHSHRKLKISVRVAFAPKQKGQFGSAAEATVTFKR
jgi:hypothetical protein